jgi:hypothetical protein
MTQNRKPASVERSVRIVNFITGEAWEFVIRMPLAATLGYTQGVSLVRRNVGVFPEYEVILGNISAVRPGSSVLGLVNEEKISAPGFSPPEAPAGTPRSPGSGLQQMAKETAQTSKTKIETL